MFRVSPNKFCNTLELRHSISNGHFISDNVRYFDVDGFELTKLESAFYEYHGIDVDSGILNHASDQQHWIEGGDDHFIIDHSLLLQRWTFVDQARYQIESFQNDIPQMVKFLNIVPKWGIDFALEHYDAGTYTEILHIEVDYRSYDAALDAKTALEQKIISTDWNDFKNNIIRLKSDWESLTGFAQNDWKARYWGLSKAEITEKVY